MANLKTAIREIYHRFKFRKYTRRYLVEVQYRINRRFELHSIVGRLLLASARTVPCAERWMRQAVVRTG